MKLLLALLCSFVCSATIVNAEEPKDLITNLKTIVVNPQSTQKTKLTEVMKLFSAEDQKKLAFIKTIFDFAATQETGGVDPDVVKDFVFVKQNQESNRVQLTYKYKDDYINVFARKFDQKWLLDGNDFYSLAFKMAQINNQHNARAARR